MNACPGLTLTDILRIVQSLGQSFRAKGRQRAVDDASLFLEIRALADLPADQAVPLAAAALSFLSIPDADGAKQAALTALPDLAKWAERLYAWWDKTTLCFNTSGSTGVPARHTLTLPFMYEETEATAPMFAGCERVVSVMPAHHIYGLMYGPILANFFGIPVVYAPPLPLASFFAALKPGDALIAFPFFWQSVLNVLRRKTPGLILPPGVLGCTATGPCPPETIRALLDPAATGDSPPLASMREIYGSTETNAIGIRLNGAEWYTLLSIWNAERLPDGNTNLVRILGDGSMLPPQPAPDVLVWNGSRHFRPERRVDKAVQVAGINVYPERVAAIIRQHPLVRDCAVRLMRPEEGSRLKAFIVPDGTGNATGDEIDGETRKAFGKPFRDWLSARLDTVARPKRITLGSALPVNEMGKLKDWD